MGPEAPGQQRLLSSKMKRATADGCSLIEGSLDLGGTTSHQAIVQIEPDSQTSRFFLSRKIISSYHIYALTLYDTTLNIEGLSHCVQYYMMVWYV